MKRYKNPGLYLASLLLVMILSGCKDNDLELPGDGGSMANDEEGITVSFFVQLDQELSSRAVNGMEGNIDNYIDTAQKFKILFLDQRGNFLFEPPTRYIQETPDKNGQYYVTVPLNSSITDGNNSSIISLIKAQMEKEPFKIAVLANWPEGDKNLISWDWDNSSLNKNANPIKNINDLHHLKEDSKYKDGGVFSFISDKGKMGLNTEWVKYREVEGDELNGGKAWHLEVKPNNTTTISSDAYTWIKNNWNPTVDKEFSAKDDNSHGIYRHYSLLWQLWNFGGAFDKNAFSYEELRDGTKDDFEENWKNRNAKSFQLDWIKSNNYVIGSNEIDGFYVVSAANGGETSNVENYVRAYISGTKHGIILPKRTELSPDDKNNPRLSVGSAKEYVKFEVPGTGQLRVRYSSLKEGENPKLVVQRGSTFENIFTYDGTAGEIKEIGTTSDGKFTARYKISITADPEDIILFAIDAPLVIYSVEFVADEYLSGTDREGIIPDEKNPIPMYGIQEFPKIDSWGSQTVLNLTQRPISLIRSLAKVELYLRSGEHTINHVYLRSMNRKSRVEPMDVLSPTANLWKSHGDNSGECEWFRIIAYGPGYSKSNFTDYYKWFYGSWAAWWPGLTGYSGSPESPHLFNPDVQRSDFCHFIYDKEYTDNSYHRYILYVPDKSIDDPNTDGDLFSAPKVCHIEYRDANMTEYLDDNNCYRIYFTDYSTNNEIKNTPYNKFESEYEKNAENLKKHWPIMRNHIYRFYVGASNSPQEIRVKVNDWGSETDPKQEVW